MATETPQEAEFISSLGKDFLLFRRMQAKEELGRLPEYRLELLRPSKESVVDPEKLLGTKVSVKLLMPDSKYRHISGWVTGVELGGEVGRYNIVRVEMRPWLWHLTLGQDCRIFQNMDAKAIIEKVFADYTHKKTENKITGALRSRPYCVQYRESDFDFVSRLMEEEGIYYYFTHTASDHTMVLCSGTSGPTALQPGTLAWAAKQTDDQYRQDVVTQWRMTQQARSLKFTHVDYDYEAPKTDLKKTASRTAGYSSPGDLEVFDHTSTWAYPKDSKNATEGDRIAKLRVAQFEAGHRIGTAATPCRAVAPGFTFTFKDHPSPSQNGDYLITAANWSVDLGVHEGTEIEPGEGFSARISVIKKATTFASQPLTPRPFVQGPQTAMVVGKSGDEIHTDPLGRVKVQFRWDRVGTSNENSSCYVRVSTPWASNNFGMISLPRVGDEVVVSFLEGNPDMPLITGRVYNEINKPPYELPAQATVSGIKSRSSKQGAASNFNELRFDDLKGSEYVWMHAEKDFKRVIKNDLFDKVGNNSQLEVVKDHVAKVGEAFDLTIGKIAKLKVGEDVSAEITGDLMLNVKAASNLKLDDKLALKVAQAMAMSGDMGVDVDAGQDMKVNAGMNLHLKGGMNINIDAGMKISLKAGAGSITIGPDGVSITGPMVKINSGGGASPATKATKASPATPQAPKAVTELKDPLAK